MNVLHLSGQLGSGGAPRVCYQVAHHLPPELDVTVAYLGGRDGYVDAFESEGIPVVRLGERPLSFASIWALFQHLRTSKYDLVHTHMMSAGVVGRLLAKIHGIPVLHTVHTNFAMRPMKAKIPDVLSAPFGTLTVCVSDSVRRSLPTYYRSEMAVVYNCIDVGEARERGDISWDEADWTMDIDPNAPIVANVARFDSKKRRIDLVECVPVVVEEFPNVQFVITGRRGTRQRKLAARTRDLGVADNVHFVGFVENPQSVYQHADVISLPSEAEGFSIGMLEAMAHERPIVATKIPAFVDALGETYPGYVPVRSPQELGTEICRLLSDSDRRERLQAIISDRIHRFSGEKAAEEYYDLYRKIVASER